MKYLPVHTTVRQLSKALKKAGLIPPSFDSKSKKQFVSVATTLGFHKNEAEQLISTEAQIVFTGFPCQAVASGPQKG